MSTIPKIAFDTNAASSLDRWIEELAEKSDPLAGDPERWPAFLDHERYGLGPEPKPEPEPEQEQDDTGEFPAIAFPDHDAPVEGPDGSDDSWPAFEPAPEDRAWAASIDIADQVEDRQSTAAWIETHDYLTDADVAIVGAVG